MSAARGGVILTCLRGKYLKFEFRQGLTPPQGPRAAQAGRPGGRSVIAGAELAPKGLLHLYLMLLRPAALRACGIALFEIIHLLP